MNKKTYFLLFVSVFLLFSACSRKDGTESAKLQEVVILDDMTREEKEELFKNSNILLKDNTYLAENLSRIETAHSEQGTKTERYFYNNLPNLKYIEIYTLANGQKQIFIHTANGAVKSVSEFSVDWLTKATPDEITGDAPIVTGGQQKENSSGIKINTLPPIDIKTTPTLPPNQSSENTPPQEKVSDETRIKESELPVNKNSSTQQTRTPVQVGESLPNFLPKKRKNVKTNNEK